MEEKTFDEQYLFSNFDSAETTAVQDDALARFKKARNPGKDVEESETNKKIDSQNKYISDLEEQNAKLKAILKRMLGPQVLSQNDVDAVPTALNDGGEIDLITKLENEIQSKPFAVVLYLNNDVSSVHRKEIDEMMKTISNKKATQDVLLAQKLQAQNSAVPIKAFTANFKGRRFNASCKDGEEPYVVCACQYFKSFFIDRMGAPLLESNPGVTDLWDIPLYQQVFMKALPILEEALNVRVKAIRQCFNCGGEHHLTDCTQPKDLKRISINRKQFSATKFKPAYQTVVEEEVDERFKHFKPGQISIGLEEALNIDLKTQVPPYIYKMRLLGYPLAWLKPSDEGLKMYGAEGNIVEEPGYEEGEIKPIKLPDVVMYPGFNAPLPEGVQDTCREFGMPRYQPELADLDIARKRAKYLGCSESEPLAKRLKFEEAAEDMEIENQTASVGRKPPLPLIEVVGAKVQPPPPEKEKEDISENDSKDVSTKDAGKHTEINIKEEVISDDESSTTKSSNTNKDLNQLSKQIDETTYRNWYIHKPLSSIGITYVMYTPPPTCRNVEINLTDLPKNVITDLDREPWKTASASWYDPLYGDLSVSTGTYDAIRTILKDTKRTKKKPLK